MSRDLDQPRASTRYWGGRPGLGARVKTVTIRQPHVAAIFAGMKRYETRSWATRYRGPLAIHAGLAIDRGAMGRAHECGLVLFPRGAIIGVVDVVDCVLGSTVSEECRRWGDWSGWAWELSNPRLLAAPIPMLGRLGLWDSPISEAEVFSPSCLPNPIRVDQ